MNNNSAVLNPLAVRVLEELLNGKAHVRELAERAGMPASTAHKTLKALEKKKIVMSQAVKNRKEYSISQDSALANSVLRTIIIEKIMRTRSFGKLKKTRPQGIVLFGSCASGRITQDSDIDLAIFFKEKKDSFKISETKRMLESELKKEVQLITLNDEKLESFKKQNTELYNQMRYNSVVLFGEGIE